MVKQLVQPNVQINETAGWCLSYAKRVFGINSSGTNAWDAWKAAAHRHEDRNFPEGGAVPVWFDWVGTVKWTDGVYRKGQYGHVAVRTADGKIWSSPLSGVGRVWFNSVDELIRAFGNGMKYVGWSEDISGVKVIEIGGNVNENSILDESAAKKVLGVWGRMSDQVNDRSALDSIIGKTLAQAVDTLKESQEGVKKQTAINNYDAVIRERDDAVAALKKAPQGSSEDTKKLNAIRDALGIK